MLNIKGFASIKTWLSIRPNNWGQVLAHRCALRSLPILNNETRNQNLNSPLTDSILIYCASANLISGIAIGLPKSSIHLKGTQFEIQSSAKIRSNKEVIDDAIYSVLFAAIFSLSASITNTNTVIKAYTSISNALDSLKKKDYQNSAFEALKHDVNWLDENIEAEGNPSELLSLPLWKTANKEINIDWLNLSKYALKLDPNWLFWIEWYQAKLDGDLHPGLSKAQQDDFYYQIATLPNEIWQEGADVINQLIAEMLVEFKKEHEGIIFDDRKKTEPLSLEIPPQNKNALQFKTNEEGIIELDTGANENELLNDQDAIDRHNEVDFLANELISSYDPNSSSANSAKPIVTKVQRYLEALGETPEEANVNFIIPRGEVLRQELEREENRDEFTSSPPLPDNFKSSLASLVGAHNIYVLLDPVLDKRDQARLGPDAKENLVSKEDGLKIVEDAFNEGLIEEEIVGAVSEDAETINEIPDPERRQDRRFSESIKNLSRLLLSNTQSIAKKIKENQKDILEAAVAGAGGGVLVTGGVIVVSSASWAVIGSIVGTGYTCFKGLQWIVKNEEWIIQRFDNKEEIKAFIEALKKLPLK